MGAGAAEAPLALLAKDGDGPGRGVGQAAYDAHERGLARAVPAHQAVDPAAPHAQAHVVKRGRGRAAKALGDVPDLKYPRIVIAHDHGPSHDKPHRSFLSERPLARDSLPLL